MLYTDLLSLLKNTGLLWKSMSLYFVLFLVGMIRANLYSNIVLSDDTNNPPTGLCVYACILYILEIGIDMFITYALSDVTRYIGKKYMDMSEKKYQQFSQHDRNIYKAETFHMGLQKSINSIKTLIRYGHYSIFGIIQSIYTVFCVSYGEGMLLIIIIMATVHAGAYYLVTTKLHKFTLKLEKKLNETEKINSNLLTLLLPLFQRNQINNDVILEIDMESQINYDKFEYSFEYSDAFTSSLNAVLMLIAIINSTNVVVIFIVFTRFSTSIIEFVRFCNYYGKLSQAHNLFVDEMKKYNPQPEVTQLPLPEKILIDNLSVPIGDNFLVSTGICLNLKGINILTGPSGSGKSTFLSVITGKTIVNEKNNTYLKGNFNDIRSFSSSFLEFDPSAKRVDFSNITPKQFWDTLKGFTELDVDKKNKMLKKVLNITYLSYKYNNLNPNNSECIGNFSEGEKTRLFISYQIMRALINLDNGNNNFVIILDEFEANLDIHIAYKVLDRVVNFSLQNNIGLIIISHLEKILEKNYKWHHIKVSKHHIIT